MILEEVLEAIKGKPVLIDDNNDNYWTVADLIEALKEYEPTYLSQEVYVNDETSSIIADGYRYLVPVEYKVVDVGETPYYVNSVAKEHRVRFRINENESRRAMSLRTYRSKQGAYQRKDALNKRWQQERVLEAPLQRRPRIKPIDVDKFYPIG